MQFKLSQAIQTQSWNSNSVMQFKLSHGKSWNSQRQVMEFKRLLAVSFHTVVLFFKYKIWSSFNEWFVCNNCNIMHHISFSLRFSNFFLRSHLEPQNHQSIGSLLLDIKIGIKIYHEKSKWRSRKVIEKSCKLIGTQDWGACRPVHVWIHYCI